MNAYVYPIKVNGQEILIAHDDKLVTDGAMDEVLKDADVIHHCMNDLSKAVKDKEKIRFENLCREFGM